ncbi:hypothetical protein J5X98_20865 [Leptothermofonsia sichuanensis E412]|uniref:hypothetical protein n=1 Tax=Leptothermofonsia sichuanensis TaxID=2917832 RepID=UPI001CA5F90A|nr:hypothetical protein [Leptothermofonsia sichuanensis]QZZ19746.1 hypothetical protein J5X98_20865 [Leptothermofonsia sichuanensis E412]
MTLNPDIMKAIERLNYRVTVGDVAAQAGLEINLAQQGLLALASDAGGHLQVAGSGEIVYLFPHNFRAILRNKYLRLRLKEWWDRVWRVLFYIIRISFGIILLVSILIIVTAIIMIILAANASSQNNDRRSSGGNMNLPRIWFSPDFFYIFYPDYYSRRYQSSKQRSYDSREQSSMNFLESVFSFLFGDGNPNADLEERRWTAIGTVIRNHKGAVIAEQIAPYLDDVGRGDSFVDENYMLPVLSRFNGRPEVSPEGDIVYHFPELQTTATRQGYQSVSAYLKEFPWRFSQASSGQILMAIGLGGANLIGALVLGSLLADGTIALQMGGFVAFVQSIYWLLLGYGAAFLAIPLIRYLWIQWRNRTINHRNEKRQERAIFLNQANEQLQAKLSYAQQFAAETVIQAEDLIYTTQRDLTEQELEQADQIDAEWQRRLNQGQ